MKLASMLLPGLASLFVADAALATATFGQSSLEQMLFCNTDEIRSDFSSPAQVSYRARGFCSMKQERQDKPAGTSTFDNYNNATALYRFNWTSTGSYNPTTKVARETMEAPPPRIDEPSPRDRPYGRFTLETICDIDPWLKITLPRCAAAKTAFTGNLSAEVQKVLGYSSVPFTSNMSFAMRDVVRAAQRKEDERLAALARRTPTLAEARATPGATTLAMPTTAPATLGKRKLPTTQPTGGAGGSAPPTGSGTTGSAAAPAPTPAATPVQSPVATPSATPQAVAPRILAPRPMQQLPLGEFVVQAAPPPGNAVANAEVEFVSLASPAQPSAVWSVPMVQLANGVRQPQGTGPTSAGRWRVRVRAAGAAVWSEPVAFDLIALPGTAALPAAPRLPDPTDLANATGRLRVPGTSPSIEPRATVDQRQITLQRPSASTPLAPVGGAGGSAPPPPKSVDGGVSKGGGGSGTRSVAAAPATPLLSSTVAPSQPPAPTQTAAAQTRPPRVTAPRPGQRVPLGQFTVKATPPVGQAVGSAELEFSWLAPLAGAKPPREPTPPARATVPMIQLAKGMPVPPGAGPSSAGRWQLRVRAAGAAVWSEPVAFDLIALPGTAALAATSGAVERQGLNPQPLPPKQAKTLEQRQRELERRGLNPQPLPPKDGTNTPRSAFER